MNDRPESVFNAMYPVKTQSAVDRAKNYSTDIKILREYIVYLEERIISLEQSPVNTQPYKEAFNQIMDIAEKFTGFRGPVG